MSDRELCYSTSKAIGDEEDTLKSFMTFDITPCEPVFKVVVGSQIVVLPTIPPSQWHFRDSNPWLWLWYHLLDHELYHSTSKSIGDEESILKSFMAFNITPHWSIFRVIVRSQIVILPTIMIIDNKLSWNNFKIWKLIDENYKISYVCVFFFFLITRYIYLFIFIKFCLV